MKRIQTLGLALAILLAAAGGASAQIQQPDQPRRSDQPAQPGADPLITELLRKVGAKEAENGFCATVNWPPGEPSTYTRWLEDAVVGASKVNTFKNGADCQHDIVTEVFQRDGRKCVRYTWSACARGSSCASGTAEACKQPGGNWDTKG